MFNYFIINDFISTFPYMYKNIECAYKTLRSKYTDCQNWLTRKVNHNRLYDFAKICLRLCCLLYLESLSLKSNKSLSSSLLWRTLNFPWRVLKEEARERKILEAMRSFWVGEERRRGLLSTYPRSISLKNQENNYVKLYFDYYHWQNFLGWK